MNKFIIITTIHDKSESIKKYEFTKDWNIIIVGDRKSKKIKSSGNLIYLSIEDQKKLGYEVVKVCPYDHYSRKNIGYLYAMQMGADVIYDTDDDNLANDDWELNTFSAKLKYVSKDKFINIYSYFQKSKIWPRGYPLDEIGKGNNYKLVKSKPVNIGVWQGMADNDPDVDAIYRLVLNAKIKFKCVPPVALEKSHYCPFNSQNTFWNKGVFPFLFLPSTVSFRFTDILRGYIAQRLFWELNYHLGFTKATVYQKRNAHDLMKDFADEVSCYVSVKPIIQLLDSLNLRSDPLGNLEKVYRTLCSKGYVKAEELNILKSWSADFERTNR